MDLSGGWVFVSHSTKDVAAVYRVRDALERTGHHPLLFFLRCVREEDELDTLITREIEARNFFLYCDSPNARASRWVQRELEYIRGLPNRVVHVVNLADDFALQLRALRKLSRAQTVFLSYAHVDESRVMGIATFLSRAEYRGVLQSDIAPANNLGDAMHDMIAKAIDDGFVIVFISRASIASRWVAEETRIALQLGAGSPRGRAAVVPVLLDDDDEARLIPETLQQLQVVDIATLSSREAANKIIARLRQL